MNSPWPDSVYKSKRKLLEGMENGDMIVSVLITPLLTSPDTKSNHPTNVNFLYNCHVISVFLCYACSRALCLAFMVFSVSISITLSCHGIVLSMSTSRTARTCFRNSKVLFIGDSQIRALQNRFLEYVNPYPEPEVEKPSEIPGRDLRVSPVSEAVFSC